MAPSRHTLEAPVDDPKTPLQFIRRYPLVTAGLAVAGALSFLASGDGLIRAVGLVVFLIVAVPLSLAARWLLARLDK